MHFNGKKSAQLSVFSRLLIRPKNENLSSFKIAHLLTTGKKKRSNFKIGSCRMKHSLFVLLAILNSVITSTRCVSKARLTVVCQFS
jgi:hypothetical protein